MTIDLAQHLSSFFFFFFFFFLSSCFYFPFYRRTIVCYCPSVHACTSPHTVHTLSHIYTTRRMHFYLTHTRNLHTRYTRLAYIRIYIYVHEKEKKKKGKKKKKKLFRSNVPRRQTSASSRSSNRTRFKIDQLDICIHKMASSSTDRINGTRDTIFESNSNLLVYIYFFKSSRLRKECESRRPSMARSDSRFFTPFFFDAGSISLASI